MAANPTNPASKRTNSRKPKAKPSQPGHDEIAERAYFIHLEQGSSDELADSLRAERELLLANELNVDVGHPPRAVVGEHRRELVVVARGQCDRAPPART